jgi:hypothetical protein
MVLNRRVMSIVLLAFGGMLTIYMLVLSATSSVAQTDPDEPTGENTGQYGEETLSAIPISEPTLPLPAPDQELAEEAESGDATPASSVYNTGDGSALCVPVQQTPVTGNQQTGQENLGVGSEDDVEFGSPELGVNPEQATGCAQTILPASVQ